MDWRKLFGLKKNSSSNDYACIKLGKKLPWEPYQKPGDFTTAMLTDTCFNIIISLTNISEAEEDAIGNKEFGIYITPVDCVPFFVLDFGGAFKSDFTLNIRKKQDPAFDYWLQSKNKTIEIFLLEGTNATLRCTRFFDYSDMPMVRSICENQRNHKPESIDAAIEQVYSEYSVEQIKSFARNVEIIPEVEFRI